MNYHSGDFFPPSFYLCRLVHLLSPSRVWVCPAADTGRFHPAETSGGKPRDPRCFSLETPGPPRIWARLPSARRSSCLKLCRNWAETGQGPPAAPQSLCGVSEINQEADPGWMTHRRIDVQQSRHKSLDVCSILGFNIFFLIVQDSTSLCACLSVCLSPFVQTRTHCFLFYPS